MLIAQKLAQYHSIPSDNSGNKKKSQLVEKLRHYLNLLNGTNPQLRERLESMKDSTMDILSTIKLTIGLQSSSPSLESLIDYSWSKLNNDLQRIESTIDREWSSVPVVFSHNDTQSRNFLLVKGTKTIDMIDFEHCFDNLYLFDIANYFVEFSGFGSSPDWESQERRKAFLQEYLQHARFLSNSNSEIDPEKLSEDCYRLVALTHLYWSLWALLQSLLNPQALSQFDYVSYAKSRFNQYKLHKNDFFNQNQ